MAERKFRKYEVLKIEVNVEGEPEQITEKKIYELSDEEIKECEFLCSASASDAVSDTFTYCLWIAMRNCRNFDKLVYGYRKEPYGGGGKFTVKVSFYKKKD